MARQRRPAGSQTPREIPAEVSRQRRVANVNAPTTRYPLEYQRQTGSAAEVPRNQFGGVLFQGVPALTGAAARAAEQRANRERAATMASLSGTDGPTATNRQRVTGGGSARMADVIRNNIRQSRTSSGV